MSQAQNINLFYTEGSSDKVYQVQLVEVDGGWKVNAQNGARGGTLKAQIKTHDPVSFDEALKIYNNLVKSKTKKGYTEDVSGSVYQGTVKAEEFTGIVPQLLNPLDEDKGEVSDVMRDDGWIAQEKHDGERRMVLVCPDEGVVGINRTGMRVPLPLCVAEQFTPGKNGRTLVDGEIMGDRYVVFDLLEIGGKCLRSLPYGDRLTKLEALIEDSFEVSVVQTSTGAAKQDLVDRVLDNSGEGIVFKQVDAPFSAGCPASGGSWRKWKFTESATLVVGDATKGKRSVQLFASDGSAPTVFVGKVSVPANHRMPEKGAMVEVGYLYRMPGDGGCLFQPTYGRERGDKTEADTLASLKVKPSVVKPQRRKAAP